MSHKIHAKITMSCTLIGGIFFWMGLNILASVALLIALAEIWYTLHLLRLKSKLGLLLDLEFAITLVLAFTFGWSSNQLYDGILVVGLSIYFVGNGYIITKGYY